MLQFKGSERKLDADDIIVSKTDLKGRISYANDIFLKIADYGMTEVLSEPHSILRHEAMPRCVFQLLWERLEAGQEIFAYVVNQTNGDDYYWVLAHVTPSRDAHGAISSYHSNRRRPTEAAISAISALYNTLLTEERQHKSRKDGQKAGYQLLQTILSEKGVSYDEFVLSL